MGYIFAIESQIAGNLDILLCHEPPFSVIGGGTSPVDLIIEKTSPGFVFCGHMHKFHYKRLQGETETEVYVLNSLTDERDAKVRKNCFRVLDLKEMKVIDP